MNSLRHSWKYRPSTWVILLSDLEMGEATQKIIDCLRTTIYTADLKIYYYCYGCFCYFHFLLLNIWYAFKWFFIFYLTGHETSANVYYALKRIEINDLRKGWTAFSLSIFYAPFYLYLYLSWFLFVSALLKLLIFDKKTKQK